MEIKLQSNLFTTFLVIVIYRIVLELMNWIKPSARSLGFYLLALVVMLTVYVFKGER